MCSASRYLTVSLLVVSEAWHPARRPLLRVCADPNDLPYSDQQQQGFENELATMIANDLGMQVTYTWFPQRGAFFRKTLNAGKCDVVMGVPAGMTGHRHNPALLSFRLCFRIAARPQSGHHVSG